MNYYVGFAPLKKWALSFILLPFCIYFISIKGQYTILDFTDLVIHEAGHFVFCIFGDFLHAAGGTIMQILYPALIIRYLLKNGHWISSQLFGFWLGHNLINISVYAADAQVRKIPLLGNGMHDWYFMLNYLSILNYAEIIGGLFLGMAIIVLISAFFLPLFAECKVFIRAEQFYS